MGRLILEKATELVVNGKPWSTAEWTYDMFWSYIPGWWKFSAGPIVEQWYYGGLSQPVYAGAETYNCHVECYEATGVSKFRMVLSDVSEVLYTPPMGGYAEFDFTLTPTVPGPLSFDVWATPDICELWLRNISVIGVPVDWPPYDLYVITGLSGQDPVYYEPPNTPIGGERHRFARVSDATRIYIKTE